MRAKGITTVCFALLLGAAAFASEQHQHIAVKIEAQEWEGIEPRAFRFDSEEAGFSLHELQLGESRAFVDAEGNNLFVVRTEDGFDFDLDGRKFSVPALADDDSIAIRMHADGDTGERHIIRRVIRVETDDEDEVDVTN